jgi:pSer/pThr/pTyr-binding forkhead associated (FHA) protein
MRSVRAPEAHLVRLKDDGQPLTAPSIPIAQVETIFGSDPIHATRILDDPSVSPLHARLYVSQGEYILSDEKSTAGTWVNYEQVTSPRRLRHGDVIHIGRVSYRFLLRKPPEIPPPRVFPLKK